MTDVAKIEQHESLPADPMVSMIERVVMSPNADLDKLERMLAMKERIDAQNARTAFANALARARSEVPPIIKDATVDFTSNKGHTHYRYETLAGIAKQIDPILSKHGLSYRFRTEQGQGGVRVTCIIQHAHGHSEETSLAGSPDQSGNKNGFQAVGSAVTYLQRYTLKAALGLSAEVDDDGHAAAPRPADRRDQPAPRQEPEFDAQAAHDRIMGKIKRAKTYDDLASAWAAEHDAVMKVGEVNADLGRALYQARNARKATLKDATEAEAAPEPPASSPVYDDEIPF